MLEEIAIDYISQTEESLKAISYGISIAGAVAAGIFHKSNAELRRAPYFAYTGLLFFIVNGVQLVWLGSVPAMAGGFLWVLMFMDVVAGLGAGYACCIMAMARSRDAYGHAGMAFLAFIPFANFWLLLKSSENEVSANRAPTIPLLKGALGVLTGFALLIAGAGLGVFLNYEIATAEYGPDTQRAGVEMLLRDEGIEETLRLMAAEVGPRRIDETTTLLRVDGDGTTLRYVYEVSPSPDTLPSSFRKGIEQGNCSYDALRPVIEAGATIEHVYQRKDGSEITTVAVTGDICGF
jgi:hypothetical protein